MPQKERLLPEANASAIWLFLGMQKMNEYDGTRKQLQSVAIEI